MPIYCCNSVDKCSVNCNRTILRRKLWLTTEKGPKAHARRTGRKLKLLQSRWDTQQWYANLAAQQGIVIPNQDESSSSSKKTKSEKIAIENTPMHLSDSGRGYKIGKNFKLVRGLSLRSKSSFARITLSSRCKPEGGKG